MTDFEGDKLASLVLSRFGNGPSFADLSAFPKRGLSAWLEEQLAPPPGDDPEVKKRLAEMRLPIKYNATDKWSAVDEMRPLSSLDKPIEELWPLLDNAKPRDNAEKVLPRSEVIIATLIRAVYSRYQLREALAQFWHDHFNINAYAFGQVAMALPAYDRDVIRRHALDNFRDLLEAVASATAMLYYLSNHSSRAGAANENYARELFELHTLGRDAYLNDKFNRWRDVPGAVDGQPTGYIDQDVYEAARAFTGWAVEDGTGVDGQRKLPFTGRFVYVESWHDGYQKRVLGREFGPFAAAMDDGRRVLDLVATHPATARHLAGKLCRRFVGPQAAPAFIERVAAEWTKSAKAPDQIVRVIGFIARSPEFAGSEGAKLKRPLALAAGFVRLTGMDFTPTHSLVGQLAAAGQNLFGYPMPTGLPDDERVFLSANALRSRWNMLLGLAQNHCQAGVCDPSRVLPTGSSSTIGDYVERWLAVMGVASEPALTASIAGAIGLPPVVPVDGVDPKRLATLVAVAAMAPAYQYS
ncbi:DUF1800 domain-containing protein [Methylomagnum sp.]